VKKYYLSKINNKSVVYTFTKCEILLLHEYIVTTAASTIRIVDSHEFIIVMNLSFINHTKPACWIVGCLV